MASSKKKNEIKCQYQTFRKCFGELGLPNEEKATFLPYRDIMADWFTEQYGPEYVEAWRAAIAQAEKEVAALNAQVLQ